MTFDVLYEKDDPRRNFGNGRSSACRSRIFMTSDAWNKMLGRQEALARIHCDDCAQTRGDDPGNGISGDDGGTRLQDLARMAAHHKLPVLQEMMDNMLEWLANAIRKRVYHA
jgi:hypothetical protein